MLQIYLTSKYIESWHFAWIFLNFVRVFNFQLIFQSPLLRILLIFFSKLKIFFSDATPRGDLSCTLKTYSGMQTQIVLLEIARKVYLLCRTEEHSSGVLQYTSNKPLNFPLIQPCLLYLKYICQCPVKQGPYYWSSFMKKEVFVIQCTDSEDELLHAKGSWEEKEFTLRYTEIPQQCISSHLICDMQIDIYDMVLFLVIRLSK